MSGTNKEEKKHRRLKNELKKQPYTKKGNYISTAHVKVSWTSRKRTV